MKNISIQQLKTEILSGLTISIALVPEAISFALLVGAAPQIGLWAAVFMALSTAIFGGRPGLISGATGATAVIMAGLVSIAGIDALFIGVIIAGIIQLLIWLTSAWKVFNRVPHAAISGFLVALAIMILTSQIKYLQINSPSISTLILSIVTIIGSAFAMFWAKNKINIPPALIAILLGTVIGIPLSFATVGDLSPIVSTIPTFAIPTLTLELVLTVLPFSFGMAISGLAESMLMVDNVSHKLNEHGSKSKETMAQGIGNIVSGLFGTMGGCVLVGQTNLNISAGAKHRISGITSALGLISIILLFGTYIELIPLVGLIGVMLVIVYETGDWKSLCTKNIHNLMTTFATIITSLLTHNLAFGIIIGSIVFYIYKMLSDRMQFKH